MLNLSDHEESGNVLKHDSVLCETISTRMRCCTCISRTNARLHPPPRVMTVRWTQTRRKLSLVSTRRHVLILRYFCFTISSTVRNVYASWWTMPSSGPNEVWTKPWLRSWTNRNVWCESTRFLLSTVRGVRALVFENFSISFKTHIKQSCDEQVRVSLLRVSTLWTSLKPESFCHILAQVPTLNHRKGGRAGDLWRTLIIVSGYSALEWMFTIIKFSRTWFFSCWWSHLLWQDGDVFGVLKRSRWGKVFVLQNVWSTFVWHCKWVERWWRGCFQCTSRECKQSASRVCDTCPLFASMDATHNLEFEVDTSGDQNEV